MREFNGYSMFDDVDDNELRAFNRARVIVNMFDQNLNRDTKKISQKGAALVIGYFANIPEEERKKVNTLVAQQLKKEGYAASTNH